MVVVTRFDLPAGTLLKHEHLVLRPAHSGPSGADDLMATPGDVVGRATRTWLPGGHPISRSHLRSLPVIRGGTFVELVYEADGLRVTADGQALEAAGLGDLVRVRNIRTGVVVLGRVQTVKSVLVGDP